MRRLRRAAPPYTQWERAIVIAGCIAQVLLLALICIMILNLGLNLGLSV